MKAYDAGYLTGQIVGYLIAAGLIAWSFITEKRNKKKTTTIHSIKFNPTSIETMI